MAERTPIGRNLGKGLTFKTARASTHTQAINQEFKKGKVDGLNDEELWKLIDVDGNGTISRDEFKKMCSVLRQRVVRDHEVEGQLQDEALRAKRRSKFLCTAVSFLVLLVAILLGGNTALSFVVAKIAAEVHAPHRQSNLTRITDPTSSPISDGATMLTDNAGRPIATTTLQETYLLADLPRMPIDYDKIDTLSFYSFPGEDEGEDVPPKRHGYKVEAYVW
jgi:hypothetical protein